MTEYIEKNKILNLLEHNDKVYHYADRDKENIVNDTVQTLCRVVIEAEAADVQPVAETENMATVSDEFICKKCGIYLKNYVKVVLDEDNEGYVDEQHYDYEPKFCPECGAKVKEG